MGKREEFIRIVNLHPNVAEIIERSPEDDMVTLRLRDGTETGINTNLALPLTPEETEEERVARVHRAVDLITSAQPKDLDINDAVPIARSADAFTSNNAHPAVVGWLTDFIGFGLAIDEPELLRILTEKELPPQRDEFDNFQIQSKAIENLHAMAPEPTLAEIGLGPDILALSGPYGNESGWFADTIAMEKLLYELWERTDKYWLAIPARRNLLLVVNSQTDQWGPILDMLSAALEAHDTLHPVPHIIADEKWRVALPDPDTELGQKLLEIQLRAQHQVYTSIQNLLQDRSEHHLAEFGVIADNSTNKLFSMAIITSAVPTTSVPQVDRLAFERNESCVLVPMPQFQQQFPHLIQPHAELMPPRFIVSTPSDDDFAQMQQINLLSG